MKKLAYILLIPMAAGVYLFFSAYSGNPEHDYPSGAPAGYTGSPGDGQDCADCHGGSSAPVTGWITSDIPAAGYSAGNTYNITVTVSGSGAKGFEVSPQDPAGTQLGTLIAGSGSHLTGGTKYVTHNSDQSSNPATWTFQWTAPASGTGDVTLYGAFAVSKNTTKTSTLAVQENTVPLTVSATANPMTILEGQSTQLDCTPAGGSGSYTYSWTSNPPGFTSNVKAPMASPVETTDYTVTVSDGANTASDMVTVTVIPVGINDPSKPASARAYPNPTRGEFSVMLPETGAGDVSVAVFSLSGAEVWHSTLSGSSSLSVIKGDLSAQPDGIYFVSVKNSDSKQYLKVIKSTR